ncbi:hypothetical protein B0I37DRAFT_309689 [Chaetomium sp. MPI-CAGE-AT-0009]|nr:hypothetical protein B0I37DRAFT_309689 [Chaetomium sp. MPI-CAGE-AT-0009]
MATQQSEGALLNEKPLQSLAVGKEGPNGSLEANGNTIPSPIYSQPDSESAPKSNGDTPNATLAKNDDAFSANQTLPHDANDEDPSAKPKGESEQEIASGMDKVKMDDAAATRDTEMPDASTDQASEHKSEALSPKSQPKSKPETEHDSPDKDQKEATAEATNGTPAVPAEKEDMAMTDTDKQTEVTAAEGIPEDTQDTAVTAETPKSPPNGARIPAADTANGHADPSTSTPPPPATADTSMSEAAQPSAKLSRERDIDSEDEPVAKRTKVDHAADQVQVKTGPVEDRMQVDQPATASRASPILGSAEPKKLLTDDSLNDSPITEWQNKQIRAVLAGVKKTKVGGPFRLPVQQIWPMVWAEYSAKISNPTDISTMEKRLRGDLPPYATMGEFKDDLELMVQNAVTFNGEGHDVTKQATACRDAILGRMAQQYAVEPPKPERKEAAKAHTTRHVEPRAPVPPIATAGPARNNKGPVPSPSQKAVESPAFALPPGSNGVPLIRRDSTKPDGRAKRPVKPAQNKDLVYDTKRKKKLPLDLRFCDELLTELRKTKHYDINAPFMQPVDPVALNIPHYHKIIKRPMDLQTMSNKLGSGEYQSSKEFEKDFDLIIRNCKTFNGEDHIVYNQALRLQDLYRAELSKRDEWMAKHAPVTTAAASHVAGRDDSDSEDADSEPDAEMDDERKLAENRLATIQKRLQAAQNKVNEMVNSGTADITDVEIEQSVVAMLQRQLMSERAKLANLPAKKASKPKPPKAKKSGGSGGLPHKKAGGGSLGGGIVKKSGVKKATPKRKIGPLEKEIIIESLGSLDGPLLERAIELIKKDTGQGENDAGELELDIETISEDALVRLYDLALKDNPNARIEKERQRGLAAPPHTETPTAKSKQPSKSKKNKPMSKSEQERRIQQLNELRAQAGRQGSGSQEPMESIEGNGNGNEPSGQPEHESEDEVDSEED